MQEIICAKDGTPAGGILVERTADGMRLIDMLSSTASEGRD
jgi:hypothetical protein